MCGVRLFAHPVLSLEQRFCLVLDAWRELDWTRMLLRGWPIRANVGDGHVGGKPAPEGGCSLGPGPLIQISSWRQYLWRMLMCPGNRHTSHFPGVELASLSFVSG